MSCKGFCTICPYGCKSKVIFEISEVKNDLQPKAVKQPTTEIVPTEYKVKKNLLGNLVAKEIKIK